MPRPITTTTTTYACVICDTVYDTVEDAEACETKGEPSEASIPRPGEIHNVIQASGVDWLYAIVKMKQEPHRLMACGYSSPPLETDDLFGFEGDRFYIDRDGEERFPTTVFWKDGEHGPVDPECAGVKLLTELLARHDLTPIIVNP